MAAESMRHERTALRPVELEQSESGFLQESRLADLNQEAFRVELVQGVAFDVVCLLMKLEIRQSPKYSGQAPVVGIQEGGWGLVTLGFDVCRDG